MMNAFSLNISSMSFLGGVKKAEVLMLAVYCDCRMKFITSLANSKKLSGIVLSGADFVLRVCLLCNVTKIAKAIVVLYPVYMVNVMFGKFASHVQPCNTMSSVILRVNHEFDISTVMQGTASNANFINIARGFDSGEKSSFRVVMEQFFEAFLSEHLKPFINRLASCFEVGQDGDESSFQPLNLAQRSNFSTI